MKIKNIFRKKKNNSIQKKNVAPTENSDRKDILVRNDAGQIIIDTTAANGNVAKKYQDAATEVNVPTANGSLEPDELQLNLYKIGLCNTNPHETTGKTNNYNDCKFLYKSDNLAEFVHLNVKKGQDLELPHVEINTIDINKDGYKFLYIELDSRIGIRTKFETIDQNGAKKWYYTNGKSHPNFYKDAATLDGFATQNQKPFADSDTEPDNTAVKTNYNVIVRWTEGTDEAPKNCSNLFEGFGDREKFGTTTEPEVVGFGATKGNGILTVNLLDEKFNHATTCVDIGASKIIGWTTELEKPFKITQIKKQNFDLVIKVRDAIEIEFNDKGVPIILSTNPPDFGLFVNYD